MAEDLYEQYAGLFDKQVKLAEEAVIGVVRAAFDDFSSYFKRQLRSLVPPLRRPPGTSANPSSNQQQLARAQEINAARDSAQRQIATALANGFGALADLSSALGTPASQSSTQATVGAMTANINDDNSDEDSMSIKSQDTSECDSDCESHSNEIEIKEEEAIDEMATTAGTPNGNSNNNDNVSVKTEIKCECDSSDSECSDEEEEELTAGRGIKEEFENAHSNDQIVGISVDENGEMHAMEEEHPEENETQFIDNPNDYNFETVHSQLVNSNLGSDEQQFDTGIIDEENTDQASNEGEGDDDGPTIIVVNYDEEFESQSIGNPNNQDTVAEGSWNEESMNIAEPNGDFVEISSSNENDNEQQSEAVIMEASSEPDQAGLSIVSNTASVLTRRSARASTAKKVNYLEATENSLTDQQGTLTGIRKRKRTIGRSRKSNAPKRSRVGTVSTVAAELQQQGNDHSREEEDDNPESEAISLSIIVRRLNCRVPGCKKVFPGKGQLDGHLLVKHAIEKYACKVKDFTESYATTGELTTHRNSAHDSLDSDWPCGQCETTCPNYNQLAVHTWQYHEYGQFACSVDKCDFTEKTRIKVQSHQLKHRPAKYRCTYAGCTSSFYMNSHLTDHLRVHSKEKPFLCSQCPKVFSHKSNLTSHEIVHSGLKPYSCTWPHCDFSASNHSTVIKHIRGIHFGLPQSMNKQREKGIIDNRDARVFLKKTTSN